MSDLSQWQQSNARQLGAALAELRQRLERYIDSQSRRPGAGPDSSRASAPELISSRPPPSRTDNPRSPLLQRLFSGQPTGGESPAPPQTEAPSPSPSVGGDLPEELPSAGTMLSERLGLSQFEGSVLLLCAGMELDTRIAGLCARAHDDPQKPFPTFALAFTLFDEPSWDVLSPQRPLRYWRLIEINQSVTQPLTSSALRADERIVNYLKGLNYLDDRLGAFVSLPELPAGSAELAPSQGAVVAAILRRWQHSVDVSALPVIQLLGPDPISKQLVACHAAATLNRQLWRLPIELLPTVPADLETLARLWQRESRLLPLALYLDGEEWDSGPADRSGPLTRFLSHGEGVFFLGVRGVVPRLGRNDLVLDIGRPTAAEQHTAWADTLGDKAPGSPALLAAQFNFNLPQIRRLARLAHAETGDVPGSLSGKAWDICRDSERPRLDALAQRLDPKMTWEDLVLPAAETSLLKQIAAQVAYRDQVYGTWGFARKMSRGFGISALFAGESGTGKTMAAEVIANGLRLNLYRIDLSAVVNKYIGETEKNLRRLFDAAEDGGAILFFDEADALFGKRSEVKDSHDRYANIAVNYLLQRIESYRGLAILATNMKSALDSAFLRRLRFIVNFPFPSPADRRRLWEKVFLQSNAPEKQPAPPLDKHLDYDRLARLNLTGGHIHNVALNAAFLAAAAGTDVSMRLILQAARTEFMKLDRPINEADFRWPASAPAAPEPAFRKAESVPV